MLKAIIFDFDGIIAHTEPVHLKAFQAALGNLDLEITEEEYFESYLAYDDRTFFTKLFKERDFEHDEELIGDMMSVKSRHYDELMEGNIVFLPGAREFIKSACNMYPLAIGSGALESEIRQVLEYASVESLFKVIVSAEDVERSKPAPDVFIEALRRLNNLYADPQDKINPGDCLVIEDSVAGIEAALEAGMKCLAITNSYPGEKLSRAHLVRESLKGLSLMELEALF